MGLHILTEGEFYIFLPFCVYSLDSSTKSRVALKQCKGKPFLDVRGNTKWFYILTATRRSTTVQSKGNVAFPAKVVTWTRHNITLYVLCLLFYFLSSLQSGQHSSRIFTDTLFPGYPGSRAKTGRYFLGTVILYWCEEVMIKKCYLESMIKGISYIK